LSLGVYTNVPAKSDTQEFIFKKADEALYHAKENGRNQYFIHPDCK